MTHFDIFNGDADGICALIQLRLASPKASELITGVKRDIKLLGKVDFSEGDTATVLDISLEKNIEALNLGLEAGASFFYADHHRSGTVPDHPALEAHINTAPNVCTGLIVDYLLSGRHRDWAIVAAFGDNLDSVAAEYCNKMGLSQSKSHALKMLGTAMNYNGYGETEDDLYYPPADLYRRAVQFHSPFDFINDDSEVFRRLTDGYREDMMKALAVSPERATSTVAIVKLPDEPWARRVSGVLGNELANRFPDRAHAILTSPSHGGGGYQVSIRAPMSDKRGADEIATYFGGGGRKGAAGINWLRESDLEGLWSRMLNTYT